MTRADLIVICSHGILLSGGGATEAAAAALPFE